MYFESFFYVLFPDTDLKNKLRTWRHKTHKFFTFSQTEVARKNKDITSENTGIQLELACEKPTYNEKY